MVNHYLGIVDG